MSVREVQAAVDSREFAEWVAFYGLLAEAEGVERPPTSAELGTKISAWAEAMNARQSS